MNERNEENGDDIESSATEHLPDSNPEVEPDSEEEADRIFSAREAQRRAALKAYDKVSGERSYLDGLRSTSKRFLTDPEPMRAGDIVMWKVGLKQGSIPEYGRPMVYLGDRAVKEPTIFSSPWDELSDAWVGFIDGDREFVLRSVDRRRLHIWPSDHLDQI